MFFLNGLLVVTAAQLSNVTHGLLRWIEDERHIFGQTILSIQLYALETANISGFEHWNNVLKVPYCFIIIFSWYYIMVLYVKTKSYLGWERHNVSTCLQKTWTEKKPMNRHTEKPTLCFKSSYTIRERVISFFKNNIKPFVLVAITLENTLLSKNYKCLRNIIIFICPFFKNWTWSHINMQGAVQM